MNVQAIGEISHKVRELSSLFTFGTSLIPFLEELFGFLEEITPLLAEVQASIGESTGKIPRVSSQLLDVTKATELASNEMLDYIEMALASVGQIRAAAEHSIRDVKAMAGQDQQLLNVLREKLKDSPEVMAEVERLAAFKQDTLAELESRSLAEAAAMDMIRQQLTSIMASLQVQDITAQQLAAADFIVQSIYARFEALLGRLNGVATEARAPEEAAAANNLSFNENARYDRSGMQQQLADQLVGSMNSGDGASRGTVRLETVQQNVEQEVGAQAAVPTEADSNAYSQEDIDRIFGEA